MKIVDVQFLKHAHHLNLVDLVLEIDDFVERVQALYIGWSVF